MAGWIIMELEVELADGGQVSLQVVQVEEVQGCLRYWSLKEANMYGRIRDYPTADYHLEQVKRYRLRPSWPWTGKPSREKSLLAEAFNRLALEVEGNQLTILYEDQPVLRLGSGYRPLVQLVRAHLQKKVGFADLRDAIGGTLP